jgi:SAM-dependent methyltransferase
MANQEIVNQFRGKLLNIAQGAALLNLIDIGYETGLFEASGNGPLTSRELAERAGLTERYVREWLGGMATGGVYHYDPATDRYTLPEEHAVWLTGDTPQNWCPYSRFLSHLGKYSSSLIACFKEGGGVSYSTYRPDFTECMDDIWGRIYERLLDPVYIRSIDGMADRLSRGIRVLDIGCGTGRAMNVLASRYPRSTFAGVDFDGRAIEAARTEARNMSLANSTFEVLDVAELPAQPKFDLITAFDAIHDQAAPDTVLRAVREALQPDGTFLMFEYNFSSRLEENIGNPSAPVYYTISLMHCVPVSIASGGPGLGLVWGEQTARQMLEDAGFGNIEVVRPPAQPVNCIFVCRK